MLEQKQQIDQLEQVCDCPICGHKGHVLYEQLVDRFQKLPDTQTPLWQLKQCLHCQHGWLDPRYKQEYLIHAYQNYSDAMWETPLPLSKSNWKRQIKLAYFHQKYGYPSEKTSFTSQSISYAVRLLMPNLTDRLDRQIRYLAYQPNGRLLDVGSGGGWFLANMDDLGWVSRGLDVDTTSAEKVRQRGIEADIGYLEEQNYAPESFDAITLSHVIEHIHDPIKTLTYCHRILKPNGFLVIFTPNIQSLVHQHYKRHWQGLEVPRHLNLFSMKSMQMTIEHARFKVMRFNTSASSAQNSWLKSKKIAEEGFYTTTPLINYPWHERCQGYLWQWWEKKLIQFGHNKGEELIVVAQKI